MRKSVLERQRGLAPMEVVRFDTTSPSQDLRNEPLGPPAQVHFTDLFPSFVPVVMKVPHARISIASAANAVKKKNRFGYRIPESLPEHIISRLGG